MNRPIVNKLFVALVCAIVFIGCRDCDEACRCDERPGFRHYVEELDFCAGLDPDRTYYDGSTIDDPTLRVPLFVGSKWREDSRLDIVFEIGGANNGPQPMALSTTVDQSETLVYGLYEIIQVGAPDYQLAVFTKFIPIAQRKETIEVELRFIEKGRFRHEDLSQQKLVKDMEPDFARKFEI